MKITNINPIFINQNQNGRNPQNSITYRINNTPQLKSHLEILGRSQVNFKGSEFSKNDRIFIDSTSEDLRLNNEEKKIFERVLKNYFKENKINSLSDINSEDDEEIMYLVDKISEDLDLTENESLLLNDNLINRLYFEEKYEPISKKYYIDEIIIEPIIKKYIKNEDIIDQIIDTMEINADLDERKSLFDIFKPENKPKESISYKILDEKLSQNDLVDILIDLNILAGQNEKSRLKNAEKPISNAVENIRDAFISGTIIDEFLINDDEKEYIIDEISKRNKNISRMQIAFEISDKYNLPSKAEQKILEIIERYESIEL